MGANQSTFGVVGSRKKTLLFVPPNDAESNRNAQKKINDELDAKARANKDPNIIAALAKEKVAYDAKIAAEAASNNLMSRYNNASIAYNNAVKAASLNTSRYSAEAQALQANLKETKGQLSIEKTRYDTAYATFKAASKAYDDAVANTRNLQKAQSASATVVTKSTFGSMSNFGLSGCGLFMLFLFIVVGILYYLHSQGKLKFPTMGQRVAQFGRDMRSIRGIRVRR